MSIFSNAFTHWKSTAQGILSFVIATCSVLTAFAAAQLAVNPSGSKVWLSISTGCAIASGLAKAWIGLISQDAGSVPAYVPGVGIKNVPSHEVPDDPAAKAVLASKPTQEDK